MARDNVRALENGLVLGSYFRWFDCWNVDRKENEMSLADEMRRVSKSVANCDEEFKEVYMYVLDKIKKAAEKGEHEIVFGIRYDISNPNYDRYKRMVIRKLEDEGFRYVQGYQIGKGTGNSMTHYVVW